MILTLFAALSLLTAVSACSYDLDAFRDKARQDGRSGTSTFDGGTAGEGGYGGSAGSDGGAGKLDTGAETASDCESACTDPCYSCNVPGQMGTCVSVPSGTDPDDDCGSCNVCNAHGSCLPVAADEPDPKDACTDGSLTDACGESGLCDGAGRCAHKLTANALCQTTCADGELSIWLCTAEHKCEVSRRESCPESGGGECNDAGSDCVYLCDGDSECPSGTHFCCRASDDTLCDISSHVNDCVLKLNQGVDCGDDRQCITGHCTDNVCCTSADCPGNCVACSTSGASLGRCAHYNDSDATETNDAPDGTCSPSLCHGCNGSSDDCVNVEYGEDWNDDCSAQPPSSCGPTGACDGNGACEMHDATTECNDGIFCNGEDTCDGAGNCSSHTGDPCAGGDACNSCNEDADDCLSPVGASCGNPTDDDCTNPDSCDGAGTCEPNHEIMDAPCGDGTDDECTSPDTCNGEGVCLGNHKSAATVCYGADQRIYDGLCDGDGSCVGTDYCITYGCWFVPPTGQERCYDGSSETACEDLPFPCDASGGPDFCGQDAQYRDNERSFLESGPVGYDYDADGGEDEVVADSLTGLVWQKDYETGRTWSEAGAYCTNDLNSANGGAGYAGQTGWRLPDYHELASLVNYGRRAPASDFPDMLSWFWLSSSSILEITGYAWGVHFDSGDAAGIPKTEASGNVRCVRGGPVGGGSALRFHTMGTSGAESVRDRATGLEWQAKLPAVYANCSGGTPEGSTCDWQEALTYCEGLVYGGHDDWRLPNVNELRSLVNVEVSGPASDFPSMPWSMFWTSSSYVDETDTTRAWYVGFETAYVGGRARTDAYAVRCVRGGP